MQKPQPDIENVTHTIAAIIELRRDEVSISPAWVATEALAKLRMKSWLRGGRNQRIAYQCTHLHCRQVARQLLRKNYEPESDGDKDQHELFPGLQARYPSAPKPGRDEPEYIRLESLGAEDWHFNVDRLRADAQSRLKHADALETWGREHFTRKAAA